MKKYDLIEIIKDNDTIKQKNIPVGTVGIILECNLKYSLVVLFNNGNWGDYSVQSVPNDIIKVANELDKNQVKEIESFVKNIDYTNQDKFNIPQFNEYDKVELIVEKDKYNSKGVYKNDVGCVLSNYAIDNEIEVDFTKIVNNEWKGNIIVVDVNDIKLISKKK